MVTSLRDGYCFSIRCLGLIKTNIHQTTIQLGPNWFVFGVPFIEVPTFESISLQSQSDFVPVRFTIWIQISSGRALLEFSIMSSDAKRKSRTRHEVYIRIDLKTPTCLCIWTSGTDRRLTFLLTQHMLHTIQIICSQVCLPKIINVYQKWYIYTKTIICSSKQNIAERIFNIPGRLVAYYSVMHLINMYHLIILVCICMRFGDNFVFWTIIIFLYDLYSVDRYWETHIWTCMHILFVSQVYIICASKNEMLSIFCIFHFSGS